IRRLRSSRPWIVARGPIGHRRTMLTFRLPAAASVVFTVKEVSPLCRVVGTFTVRGHAGLNKVVFRGRVRGRTLPSGTYRISARRRGGAAVLRVTVVIVESGVPSPTELAAAKRSNVCGVRAALASSRVSGNAAAAAPEQPRKNPPQATQRESASPTGGVAGTTRTHASPFTPSEVSKHVTNPLVIAALAAAVLLLGLAALPKEAIPDPRLTDALTRHRVEVALAGAAALATAAVALAFA